MECQLPSWYLNFQSLMEIHQSLSSTQCYFQPDVPWEDRVCFIEQMVIQGLVWHELIDQQPLRTSFTLRGTVPDELNEIWVFNNPQKMNFCQPLLLALIKLGVGTNMIYSNAETLKQS